MLMLIFIYYLKNILSISDIQTLLEPLSNKYFNDGACISLSEIYSVILEFEQEEQKNLFSNIKDRFLIINKFFPDLPKEDQEELRLFAYICSLAFDVYIKKQIIETLIDEIKQRRDESGKK
jgi:hypothetical protein